MGQELRSDQQNIRSIPGIPWLWTTPQMWPVILVAEISLQIYIERIIHHPNLKVLIYN